MSSLPESLVRDLARGRVVAYIGAGFTAICGLPGWSNLLLRILDRMDRESQFKAKAERERIRGLSVAAREALGAGQFAYCASLVRRAVNDNIIREEVKLAFDRQHYYDAPEEMRLRMKTRALTVMRAPFAGIITTNYDEILEEFLGTLAPKNFLRAVGPEGRLGDLLQITSNRNPFFVKLHGSLGDKIVLSTEEYDRTYMSHPATQTFLNSVMLSFALLFVGCSIEDKLVEIRRRLFLDFDGMLPTAYAILPESPRNEARAAWLQEYVNIETIFYNDHGQDHLAVDAILSDLSSRSTRDSEVRNGVAITRSVQDFLRMDVQARLEGVGERNRAIVQMIVDWRGRRVDQATIIQMLTGSEFLSNTALERLDAEEFVYRVMFLHQIGLVREASDVTGRIAYEVSEEVARTLARLGKKRDAPSRD